MESKRPPNNFTLLCSAWKVSGGWKGNGKSLEFRLSVLVWVISAHAWVNPKWWDVVLGVLPTVLGFTLSGFAIFLGFGSDAFKRFLARDVEPERSLYMSVSAAFIVFVTFQVIALLFALSAKALYFPPPVWLLSYLDVIQYGTYIGGGIGYFLFVYSLALSLRAALRIFRIARWYNLYLNFPNKKEKMRRRRRARGVRNIGGGSS